MYLKSLRLRSFRNYVDRQIEFTAQKTILVGNNAQGKSNLLEAVELLASLKSHRATRDRELVLDSATAGQVTATVEGAYGTRELSMVFRKQGRRTVAVNRENLRRQLDFLGVLNAVQFSSLDLDLVRGAPESRRSWIDGLLVQLEPVYSSMLQQYNQVLKQRNALLKKIRAARKDHESSEFIGDYEPQSTQLKLWDEQLAAAGSRVTRRRARVINRLAPIAESWHRRISGDEQLQINYLPNVEWTEDDPVKVQQAFLALKLAELKLIEEVVGEPPLLLLDDVLAELDPNRQKQLLAVIGDRFQTIITTTHIDTFNQDWIKDSQILAVEAGNISEVIKSF